MGWDGDFFSYFCNSLFDFFGFVFEIGREGRLGDKTDQRSVRLILETNQQTARHIIELYR